MDEFEEGTERGNKGEQSIAATTEYSKLKDEVNIILIETYD